MRGVRWRKRLEFPRKNLVLKEAERKKLYQPEPGQSVGVNPDTKPHLPHPNRCPNIQKTCQALRQAGQTLVHNPPPFRKSFLF